MNESKDPFKTFKSYLLNENVISSNLEEKKDEEEITDEVSDEADNEITDELDTESEFVTDDSSPTGETSEIQDHLEAAIELAKGLGDDKLTTQIGNTIVYLNRSQYSGVNENENNK